MFGHNLAWWNEAMLLSLGIAAFCALAVAFTTTIVVKLQGQAEIDAKKAFDDSQDAFNKYKIDAAKDIAEANARAAEAKLELEKFRTPRTLNTEQQARITEKIKPFSGTKFDVGLQTGDPEAQNLLLQIEDALNMAKLDEIDWNNDDSNGIDIKFSRPNGHAAGLISMTGVIIQVHPEKIDELKESVQAIASALNAENINCRAELGLGVPNTNKNAIHILIGKKP